MSQDFENLPPELEGLHEELDGLQIDERPSFGPELRRELELLGEAAAPTRRSSSRRRLAAAAVVGGLLALSVAPQARAALLRVATAWGDGTERVAEVLPVEMPTIEGAPVSTAAAFVPLEDLEARAPSRRPPAEWTDAPVDALVPSFAYPELRDPDQAQRIIELFYPRHLQQAGIGGSVRVMVWIDEDGRPEDGQTMATSGVPALDRAAERALGRLQFRPARRQGEPVGSWVRFTIQFRPRAQQRAIDEAGTDLVNGAQVVTADSSTGVIEPY